jgi:hypothetical protein
MAAQGFSGCVGFVDGTYVVLRYCPTRNGETFFNRKSRYAYNIMLVCDDMKQIRYVVCGWPGSVYDSSIWKSSPLSDNPRRFFAPHQYVLADSAYALDEHIIPVYRQPAASIEQNKRFNELVAAQRVRIEHVNGVLFGRWGSLDSIRTLINSPQKAKHVS